jgi:hypothetical protein
VRHIRGNGQQVAGVQQNRNAGEIEAHGAGGQHSDLFVHVLVDGRGYSLFEAHSQNRHPRSVNHLPGEARTQFYFGDLVPAVVVHLDHDRADGGGNLFGIGEKLLRKRGCGRHANIGRSDALYL